MLPSWKTWRQTDKEMWSGWVVTITLFWLLFLVLTFITGISAIDSHPAWRNFPPRERIFVADVLFFAWFAGLVGLAQWLLLRTYIQHRSWWIPSWVVASVVSWTGILVVIGRAPSDIPLWSLWITGAVVSALLQWLLIRPYLAQAAWWALSDLSVLALSIVLSTIIPFFLLVAGPFYAALSGYVLISFFRSASLHADDQTSPIARQWIWHDMLSILCFWGCIGVILVGYTHWRVLWYLSPPPPPIYPNAAAVIAQTVGGRRATEHYTLVMRFPQPARGHQEQIVVLDDYSNVFREPVDAFFYTLRAAKLSGEQITTLDTLRAHWCQQEPQFRSLQPTEPFYDVGVTCREQQAIKDVQIPVDQLPQELAMLRTVVAGDDGDT
jgi:hypothetical protein